MKVFVCFLCIMLLTSCMENPFRWHERDKIRVEGRIVETYYDTDTIFSVRPLSGVNLRLDYNILTETNNNGYYKAILHKIGAYTLFAEKYNYKTKQTHLNVILGDKLVRDFYLERLDEHPIGWQTFPMSLDGGKLMITADGLTLTSGGKNDVYAVKDIKLKNHQSYKFTASMKKDPLTRLIYFAIQPQIKGSDWIYDSTNLNNWREAIISFNINDTSIVDMSYIYDDAGVVIDTLFVYPDSVDVLLKIGAEQGSDFPIGYFREIKIKGL